MKFKTNKTTNESAKNRSHTLRWIFGILFAICTIANGFRYSSLFLLCSSILMLPIPFLMNFLNKKNIQPKVAIILSIILLFLGIMTSPTPESTNPPLNNNINNNEIETSETLISETAKPDEAETSASETEKPIKVETSVPETACPDDAETSTPETTKPHNEETSKPNNLANNEEKVKTVWVTASGKKYHSKSSCSNMKTPSEIPLTDAINRGYTACSKCH